MCGPQATVQGLMGLSALQLKTADEGTQGVGCGKWGSTGRQGKPFLGLRHGGHLRGVQAYVRPGSRQMV